MAVSRKKNKISKSAGKKDKKRSSSKKPAAKAKPRKKTARRVKTSRQTRRTIRPKSTSGKKAASPVIEKMQAHIVRNEQAEVNSQTVNAGEDFASYQLPANYGDNIIYIMVRDPYWIYSYWEIQRGHQERVLGTLGGDWNVVTSVLRVYDATQEIEHLPFYDIELNYLTDHWYLNVEPNRAYFVEIGLRHQDGRFAALARSNQVMTPRSGASEIVDEEWMSVDFDKVYALSGGFRVGDNSASLRKQMEERLMHAITSGSGVSNISSASGVPVQKKKKRQFWFELDCELIVYGATEPDATVLMQGRPVSLRPDGTFTLRYALPDGKQTLDCHAFSKDGLEKREITPVVERRTSRPAPILNKAEVAK